MKEIVEEKQWVLCPICGAKTRLQLLPETELKFVSADYFGVVERFSVFAATGFNAALGIHLFCMNICL